MEGPTQVLFSNIDYDDYVGRIGIGRVERGSIQVGQTVIHLRRRRGHPPERPHHQAVPV